MDGERSGYAVEYLLKSINANAFLSEILTYGDTISRNDKEFKVIHGKFTRRDLDEIGEVFDACQALANLAQHQKREDYNPIGVALATDLAFNLATGLFNLWETPDRVNVSSL
jgi:hypothetical protein